MKLEKRERVGDYIGKMVTGSDGGWEQDGRRGTNSYSEIIVDFLYHPWFN